MCVLVELLSSVHLGGKRFDVLGLHLLHHLEEISCVPFQYRKDGAVTRRPVGTDKYYDGSISGVRSLSEVLNIQNMFGKLGAVMLRYALGFSPNCSLIFALSRPVTSK
jgi:hypothetical protein